MKRRTFLVGSSVAISSIAGCLNGNNTQYEQCRLDIVYIDWLPETPKDEAITAIENDEYETHNDATLPQVIDIEETYLYQESQDTYYRVRREEEEGVIRLHLEETLPSTGAVWVHMEPQSDLSHKQDDDDATFDADIRIEHEDEVLTEETLELEEGESTQLDSDVNYRYGSYYAEVTIHTDSDKYSDTAQWDVGEPIRSQAALSIQFSSDGIDLGVARDSSDIGYCEWDSTGELQEDWMASN